MNVNNISHNGIRNYGNYYPYEQQNITSEQQPQEDKTKSNAAKYMIGATALAGLVALGVLGHKGYLGKDVQKFMKNIGEEAGKITKKEPSAPPKAIEFKAAEGATNKVCQISEELKQAVKLSEEHLYTLEKLEHDEFGTLHILKKYDNGKPQFVSDYWHIYEFEKESGKAIKRMAKDIIWKKDGELWTSKQFISEIEKLDPTNPKKVLSKVTLDTENNVCSYIKNTEWDTELRPIVEHHYANDMETLEKVFHNKYESDFGYQLNHTLEYAPDGKTLLSKKIYDGDKVAARQDYFPGTNKTYHSTYYKDGYINYEEYFRKNQMLEKELYYDKDTHYLCVEYRYHEQPRFKLPWQRHKNRVSQYIEYDKDSCTPNVINTTYYDKKGRIINPEKINLISKMFYV